jgi:riboflavin kinase/FMN adenylyltransferase
MIVANNLETLHKLLPPRPVRIALGNFDGVHLGHRKLLGQLVAKCKAKAESSVVVTFSPHPAQFFGRNKDFRKIDTPTVQQAIFRDLGVDATLELAFNEQLASLTGDEFVDSFLKILRVREILVGEDFRFGKARASGLDTLQANGKSRGFDVTVVKTVETDGAAVSSSRLRALIAHDGDMLLVSKYLARPFCLQGLVADGRKIGRTLGFPTANLSNLTQVIPKTGVYAGWLSSAENLSDGRIVATDLPCVVNVGVRPTFGSDSTLAVEAHVYGPNGNNLNLYNQTVFLKFIRRIRAERRFESADDLKQQILKDIEAAQEALAH